MKNNWKIAFWICLIAFLMTGLFGLYSIIDQGVTITYMKEGYSDTESDLETLITIIRSTDQTKNEIKEVLINHRLYEYMDFNTDTIYLEKISLIFENDTLKEIEEQW